METKFNIIHSKKATTLAVQGELLVKHAPAFKAKLEELLGEGNELNISLKAVKTIDASAIQLIVAFRKENASQAVSVSFPEDKEISDLLNNVGLRK
jgi:anti-anti-sigma factor